VPIRNFRADDIDFALDLVHKEGWLYDRVELERMLTMDPRGSFVFEDRAPLGFITCVTYRRTGVIGHLVVSENARGRKIGKALVKQAVDYASAEGVDSLLLFATKEGAEVYKKQGFRTLAEVLCIQADRGHRPISRRYRGLSQVAEDDLKGIVEIDAAIFGDDRSKLIGGLYRDHPGMCFKLERSGRIQGYAFGRTTALANDFGPWVCMTGTEADARALFDSVASQFDDRSIFMGVLSQNENAVRVASGIRPIRTWNAQLMVRGEARYVEGRECFLGLVGFELG